MGDGLSFSVITQPTVDAFKEIEKAVEKATQDAIRQSGREAQKVARAAAPVYGGKGAVHIRAVKKARRAGVNLMGRKLAKGELVEGKNQVVAGLLRDSITAGRPRRAADGWVVRIAPRGPRVHLYAGKEEGREHFMVRAYEAVVPMMRAIHELAWAKATRRD